jgi:hypothetical protein
MGVSCSAGSNYTSILHPRRVILRWNITKRPTLSSKIEILLLFLADREVPV